MHQKTTLLLVSSAVALACGACEIEATPEARAANVAQLQCGDPKAAADEARVLHDTTIVKVQPMLFRAGADVRSDGIMRVEGIKLLVRPPEGVSNEEMARILQCHSAKAILGRVDPALVANDPYLLPDVFVEIEVVSEQGFVVVKESADRVWQNLALLHRATAFAEEHREHAP